MTGKVGVLAHGGMNAQESDQELRCGWTWELPGPLTGRPAYACKVDFAEEHPQQQAPPASEDLACDQWTSLCSNAATYLGMPPLHGACPHEGACWWTWPLEVPSHTAEAMAAQGLALSEDPRGADKRRLLEESKASAAECRRLEAQCKSMARALKDELTRRTPKCLPTPWTTPPPGLEGTPRRHPSEPALILPSEIVSCREFDERPSAKLDDAHSVGLGGGGGGMQAPSNADTASLPPSARSRASSTADDDVEPLATRPLQAAPPRPVAPSACAVGGAESAAADAEEAQDQYVWKVPRSKFTTTDRSIVSPPFFVERAGGYEQFKVQATATKVADRRGCQSFKKAKGTGKLELQSKKAPADGEPAEPSEIFFMVGNEVRGPILHNFSERAQCGLARDQEEWNFLAAAEDSYISIVVKMPGCKVSSLLPSVEAKSL